MVAEYQYGIVTLPLSQLEINLNSYLGYLQSGPL